MRVMHTGMTVTDLERSIEFYCDVLGFKLMSGPSEYGGGEERSRGIGVPGAWYRGAVLEIDGGALEIMQFKAPPSPIDRPTPPNAIGFYHMSFSVDDIHAKVAEFKAKGVEFLAPVRTVEEGPFKGYSWVYMKDPDGCLLELVEYNP